MFRLFLRKKILDGEGRQGKRIKKHAAESVRRNRRVFSRFPVDHKHLTLMNEQDILLVREFSAKGFSTEVSPRGFDRLTVGDVYDARIRYLGEIYDLQAKVAWKHDNYVGFEIMDAEKDTLRFIRRLIRPIEIATSLKEVDAAFMQDQNSGKVWYHGDEDSDLYVWHDPEQGHVRAWQLTVGDLFVEWSENTGLSSGQVKGVQGQELMLGATLPGLTHNRDEELDEEKRRFAIDVMMALPYPVRDEILNTVTTG